MKFKSFLAVILAELIAFAPVSMPVARAQVLATQLPPGKQCFQATTGLNGMVGTIGAVTAGTGYVNGSYGGVPLTGGSGTNATANITVAGGIVSSVTILSPGVQYVVGDVLSATAASIGGTGSGFSFPVASTSINSSLAGGSVAYYIPNTLTLKQTWQNSTETVLNQNPVPLDANGCAVVYGNGTYRQILKDSLLNTIWDVVTSSTGSSGSGASGQIALGDNAYVGDIHAYAGMVAPPNYMFTFGQALDRTTYAALFSAITYNLVITCSLGSNVISGIADTTPIGQGNKLEASCFAPGSVVLSKTSNSVTMSSNATASTAVSGRFFFWGNGDGSTTFNLPQMQGYTLAGRDNMSGGNSGTLNPTYFGNNPDALGAAGGNQSQTLNGPNLPAVSPAFTGTAGPVAVTSTQTNVITGSTVAGNSGSSFTTVQGATQATIASTGTFTPAGIIAALGIATPFSVVQPTITINYIIKVQADTISTGLAGVSASFPLVATASSSVVNLSLNIDPLYFGVNASHQLTMLPALGGMAYQAPSAVAITGGAITGMPAPTNPTDVANKSYVDSLASGLTILAPSSLATAAVLPNTPTYANGALGVGATLTAGSNSTLTVDGTVAALNTVVLVKNQASAFQNGIYTVTTAGGGVPWVLTRATYFDQAAEIKAGSYTLITSGGTLGGNAYTLQTSVTTVGTDPINFALFSQPSASPRITTRQSIMSSSVDSTGQSNFAAAGSGLNVNLSATAAPLTLTFASGFNATTGSTDLIGQLASDVISYWAALPANQYSFLSVDRNASTGVLSATQTLMRPQSGPVFYAPRQALLHFDGGSAVDDWGNAWNAVGAGVTYTGGCAKFGALGASITGTTSYIQSPSIFNPGLGNWTIDVWANLTSNVSASIFSVGNLFGMYVATNASGKLTLFLSSGGASWDISPGSATGSTVVTTAAYHHFALVFNGTTYVLYLDGLAQLTVTSSTIIWPDGVAMGMATQIGTGNGTAGCFDEFDFVPFARWVANFTPPVAAYTVAGDWFDTNKMVMNTASGAGPTWSPIQRLYVAEAATGASSVSATYDYSQATQFGGQNFSLNGVGKLKVGNHVIYAEGTPQFITGSTPGTPCSTVPACTIGSPVTWVMTPSQVPPDAKWFDVQINVFHAAIGGTNPGSQDCTLQSRIPIGTIQGFVALGAQYSNYTGFGTITNATAFTEGAGAVVRYPVINGVAAFETSIGGGTCSTGGTNNQARIVSGILIGYDMP